MTGMKSGQSWLALRPLLSTVSPAILLTRGSDMRRPRIKPSERLRELMQRGAQWRRGPGNRLDVEMSAFDRTAGRVDVRALLRR